MAASLLLLFSAVVFLCDSDTIVSTTLQGYQAVQSVCHDLQYCYQFHDSISNVLNIQLFHVVFNTFQTHLFLYLMILIVINGAYHFLQ